jgi:DNA-binding PadR family transcriptional regulator
VLELAILGLLAEQELHGYEIRKRLRDELGLFANVSFGSLYPALARLEAAGAVVGTESDPGDVAPAPVPHTGSLGGERATLRARRPSSATRGKRSRKVYRITDAGREQFERLLDETGSSEDTRGFSLRLAFARHLGHEARLGLLERRRAHLVQRLAAERARVASTSSRGDVYTRSLAEHSTETTEQDISWLDRLIDAERVRRIAAGSPETGTAGNRTVTLTDRQTKEQHT